MKHTRGCLLGDLPVVCQDAVVLTALPSPNCSVYLGLWGFVKWSLTGTRHQDGFDALL